MDSYYFKQVSQGLVDFKNKNLRYFKV